VRLGLDGPGVGPGAAPALTHTCRRTLVGHDPGAVGVRQQRGVEGRQQLYRGGGVVAFGLTGAVNRVGIAAQIAWANSVNAAATRRVGGSVASA
jgi:hypothetical protein